ncbi:MAG: hypothetical protein JNL38_18845, partial [Myxococcales bacterium]|nr:hypothetical protein [Myxococcales bacterium]
PVASAPPPAPASPALSAQGCRLGAHEGIDDVDAKTAARLVCSALAEKAREVTAAEVRLEKLGARIILTVVPQGGAEKHAVLSGVEEVPTAAPRLAESVAEVKPVADTETVKNVLTTEAAPPRTKSGQVAFNGGIIGVAPLNIAATPAPGVDLGLIYRGERWGVSASGRYATSGDDIGGVQYVALASGARYSFGDGAFAPYAGAGVSILAVAVERRGPDFGGVGLGLYGEVGVDALRTHRIGFTAGVRVDAPLFADEGVYALPVSLLVGMQFR